MDIIKNKTAYIITILSIFLNMLFFWSGTYDYLEQKLYDYRLMMRGPLSGDYISSSSKYKNIKENKAIKYDYTNDNDVVIIGLDQDSYENIGRYYPYDRGLIWAKVIDNLVEADISVIVFEFCIL